MCRMFSAWKQIFSMLWRPYLHRMVQQYLKKRKLRVWSDDSRREIEVSSSVSQGRVSWVPSVGVFKVGVWARFTLYLKSCFYYNTLASKRFYLFHSSPSRGEVGMCQDLICLCLLTDILFVSLFWSVIK